jgi:tRNA(fMet)-specific endonuclease VapC
LTYLLDSNAVIELLREPDGALARRARAHDPVDVGLSVIALHELYFGAFRSTRQEHNLALVDSLRFEIVDYEPDDARVAGEIRADLACRGLPIGPYDVLIAGQARARGLTLVTANVQEFSRVAGLEMEDWSGQV